MLPNLEKSGLGPNSRDRLPHVAAANVRLTEAKMLAVRLTG